MKEPTALHAAFVRGDLEAIRSLLGQPDEFPKTCGPDWLGDLLIYAIYWIRLRRCKNSSRFGADPRVDPQDGFPPLIATTDREPRNGVDDRVEVLRLLLAYGADPNLRGMNDGRSPGSAVPSSYTTRFIQRSLSSTARRSSSSSRNR